MPTAEDDLATVTPDLASFIRLIDNATGDSAKALVSALYTLFVNQGTALTDLQAATDNADNDDTWYGEEDGTPIKWNRLKLFAGIDAAGGTPDADDIAAFGLEDGAVVGFTRALLAAAVLATAGAGAGTPDADDLMLGVEDGSFVGFTRAQIAAAVSAVDLFLVKSFGTTTQTISNTTGRRITIENDNTFAANDIRLKVYLDSDDTAAVINFGTAAGLVSNYQVGVGGSTAVDTTLGRVRAGVFAFSTPSTTSVAASGPLAGGSQTAAVGNITTGEDNLQSYSCPANLLTTDGDVFEMDWHGTFANNANAKTLRVKWNAATIVTVSLPINTTGSWKAKLKVTRTAAATQDIWAEVDFGATDGTMTKEGATATGAATLSGAVTALVTGDATATNDIVSEQAKPFYWAA